MVNFDRNGKQIVKGDKLEVITGLGNIVGKIVMYQFTDDDGYLRVTYKGKSYFVNPNLVERRRNHKEDKN